MRVEGKEDRGCHRSQEHHPQHGILGDQANALNVGRGDVAAAPEIEGDDGDERGRKQEIERDVGEPAPVGDQSGRPRETDGAVLIEQPVECEARERHAKQHADGGFARREAFARGAALVHARGETLADQPGHDQHHALDAEGDQNRKQRRGGEVAQTVEGRVAGGERQGDGGGAQQRELPVAEHHLFDDFEEPVEKTGNPKGNEQGAREQDEKAVLGLPDAVDERDDVKPHHQVSR